MLTAIDATTCRDELPGDPTTLLARQQEYCIGNIFDLCDAVCTSGPGQKEILQGLDLGNRRQRICQSRPGRNSVDCDVLAITTDL